jgi:RNA polymerase sigma-70 factor (ECF subfamily)
MRTKADIEGAIDAHGDTVWRVCVLYFKYHADAQDAFQETLLKYSINETAFTDEEHRKAWLIRVATNVCKDIYKAAHRKNISINDEAIIEDMDSRIGDAESISAASEVLIAIRSLSDPPRTPVYLALYEGYSAPEISKLLDAPVNTVYSWIARGKQQLREALQ